MEGTNHKEHKSNKSYRDLTILPSKYESGTSTSLCIHLRSYSVNPEILEILILTTT